MRESLKQRRLLVFLKQDHKTRKVGKTSFLTLILFTQYETMQFFRACKEAANTLTNDELAEI